MRTRNILISIAVLLLGAGAGVTGMYFFEKNKLTKKYEKEIDSVKKCLKEYYDKKIEKLGLSDKNTIKSDKKESQVISDPDADRKRYGKYAGLYNKEADSTPSAIDAPKSSIKPEKPVTKPIIKKVKQPYVISPDMYRESEYNVITLYWYRNSILTDVDGNVIHDADGLIGPGSLDTFGKFEDDAVYVRDDEKKVDYEILYKDEDYR